MVAFGTDTVAAERYAGTGLWNRLRRHPAGAVFIVCAIFLVACVVVGEIYPDDFRFTRTINFKILLRSFGPLGILAIGMGILMIAGEFDLSAGAIFIVGPYVGALAWEAGVPLPIALIFSFVTAAGIGLFNGTVTVVFRIPSFIVTLGMMFVIRFGSRFVTGNTPVRFKPSGEFNEALAGQATAGLPVWLDVIPAQFVWFLVIAVLAYFLLNRHRLGNHFFAVGGSAVSAAATGINVARTKVIAFMICPVLATFAGILSVARLERATNSPQLFLELEAIAICVMGGLALTGGRGAVFGIVLGTVILQTVRDVLVLSGAPGAYLDMFVGGVIVVAVTLNTLAAKRY